jgi:hypothetical protein
MRTLALGALALALALPSVARAQDLQPPPPIDPNDPNAPNKPPQPPPQNEDGQSTKEQLEKAEKEDSGRNFELIYINGDANLSYINMESFNADKLALQKSSSLGPMFSLGAGLRFLVFTAGVRAKLHQLSSFNLWQLNAEAAFHLTETKFDPYIGAHVGYSFVGTLNSGAADIGNTSAPDPSGDVKVRGVSTGLDLGFDYYLSSLFSIGFAATGEALFLQRPKVDIPASVPPAVKTQLEQQPLYQNSGSAAGLGVYGGLRLGLHIGI